MGVLDRFRLDDRVAIVTGGSKGLGEAIALGLAEAGASVAITSRHLDECQETGRRIAGKTNADVFALQADVADAAQIEYARDEVLERFGRIDILVNNAGINVRTETLDLSIEEWQAVIEVNLTGPLLCMKSVLPTMLAAGWGRIVNIASTLAVVGLGRRAPYTASKGGLLNMTRDAALEFAATGVTVNAVCPGPFDTPLNRPVRDNPDLYQSFLSKVPMGRWGDPSELAPAVLFLASEASSFVTGAALLVDGGWTAQ